LISGQAYTTENDYFYCNIIRDVDNSRYGGNTYVARSYNSYIGFSDIISISQSSVECIYGDVYSNYLKVLRSLLYKKSSPLSFQEIFSIPVISPTDIRYRLDYINEIIPNQESWTGWSSSYAIQETEAKGIELYEERYPSIGDLYRYNSVYSRQLDSTVSYPKPFDFTEDSYNNVKVIASKTKVDGEYTDSWT
jgi:hypothetical protein